MSATLIPSQSPGSPGGYAYTWKDRTDLLPDATYFYWLEDVGINGATTMHGPVSVTMQTPTAVTLSGVEAGAADLPVAAGEQLIVFLVLVALLLVGAVLLLAKLPQRSRPKGE